MRLTNFIIFCFLFCFIVFAFSVNGQVIINEIMYNPLGNDTNSEWIEIYNNGTEIVNLTGWKFFEANTNHGLSLGQGEMTILPNEYVIIVQNVQIFLSDYSQYSGKIIDSSWSDITNSLEKYFAIKNSSGEIVDEIVYYPLAKEGKSIELINFNLDNNISSNWNASLNVNGTPGKQNSIFKTILIKECLKLNYNECSLRKDCVLWRDGDLCVNLSVIDNKNWRCSDLLDTNECSKISSCEWVQSLNRCIVESEGYCGNNRIDKYEICDGNNLNGKSCTALGFNYGILRCVPQCSSYDASSCVKNPKISRR